MWFEHIHRGLRTEILFQPPQYDHHRKHTLHNTRRKKVSPQARKKPIEQLHTKVQVVEMALCEDTDDWTLLHAQNASLQVQSDDHDDFVMVDPKAFH